MPIKNKRKKNLKKKRLSEQLGKKSLLGRTHCTENHSVSGKTKYQIGPSSVELENLKYKDILAEEIHWI